MSTVQISNRVAAAIIAAVLALVMLVAVNYRVQGSHELARQTAAVRVVTLHTLAREDAEEPARVMQQAIDAYTKALNDALAPPLSYREQCFADSAAAGVAPWAC